MSLVLSLKPAHVVARCEMIVTTAMDAARRSKVLDDRKYWVKVARGAMRNLRAARKS